MQRFLVLATLAIGCLATGLPAQEALPVYVGDRIRIRSTEAQGVFVVRSIARDTIVLARVSSDAG
jgi:hypothetical protein